MSQMDMCEWRRRVEGVLGTCGVSANVLRKITWGFPSISVIDYASHIGSKRRESKGEVEST